MSQHLKFYNEECLLFFTCAVFRNKFGFEHKQTNPPSRFEQQNAVNGANWRPKTESLDRKTHKTGLKAKWHMRNRHGRALGQRHPPILRVVTDDEMERGQQTTSYITHRSRGRWNRCKPKPWPVRSRSLSIFYSASHLDAEIKINPCGVFFSRLKQSPN